MASKKKVVARKVKAAARKSAVKASARKAGAGKAAKKKTTVKAKAKAASKRVVAKKGAAKKAALKKPAVKKTAVKKQAIAKKVAVKKKAVAKKSPATQKRATRAAVKAAPANKAPSSGARRPASKVKSSKRPASAKVGKRPYVLVTGAGGALAQLVMSRLKRDYRVIALDFRHRPEISACEDSFCVQFTRREFEDIFRRYPIEGVIHLGRISAQQLSRESRYNANVIGSKKLFDLCVKYGVKRVLMMSTYHVYGAHPYNPALIDEDAPLKAAGLTTDLVDSVELENLAAIYLWKHPELNVTVLRPCNTVGPGVNNTMSRLLAGKIAPWIVGFSPVMQFMHVDDAAAAVASCYRQPGSGIYNLAPDDWVSYSRALEEAGCVRLPVPSMPEGAAYRASRILRWRAVPPYLVNYFKYPVVIDGARFREEFGFKPRYSLREIFAHYREFKD